MALGTYEHNELRNLLQRLQPGDTFIDVGAHIGYLSLPIAKRVGPSGKVIALEPSPTSLELLRRNVALNGFNWVTVVDAAASDKDGLARLHMSSQSAMWNTLRQGTLDEETGSIEVVIRSLDSLMEEHGWPSIAGIKLDVEGAELEVLRGSEKVLARNPRAFVMIEVSGGNAERVAASLETLRWFEERGYQFRRFSARGAGPPMRSSALIPLLKRRHWYESLFNVVIERG